MAWVNIKGHRYYRQSRRVNGRVVNRHIGAGAHGELMEQTDLVKRGYRKEAANLAPSALLLNVPTGFLRIFDRDLVAAGIPKRDERKRTVDLHALRTTFATMLSTTGTAP